MFLRYHTAPYFAYPAAYTENKKVKDPDREGSLQASLKVTSAWHHVLLLGAWNLTIITHRMSPCFLSFLFMYRTEGPSFRLQHTFTTVMFFKLSSFMSNYVLLVFLFQKFFGVRKRHSYNSPFIICFALSCVVFCYLPFHHPLLPSPLSLSPLPKSLSGFQGNRQYSLERRKSSDSQ